VSLPFLPEMLTTRTLRPSKSTFPPCRAASIASSYVIPVGLSSSVIRGSLTIRPLRAPYFHRTSTTSKPRRNHTVIPVCEESRPSHALTESLPSLYHRCVARGLERCDHDRPRWGAHNTSGTITTSSVLGAPASLIGSELLRYWAPALRFAPPRSRRDCLLYIRATGLPSLYIRNIIPDDLSIPLMDCPYRAGPMRTFTAP
jgi:hypothetical protein